MSAPSTTVTIDSKMAPAFAATGAAAGFVGALLVGPVVSWLLNRIDTAPGPLRLIDQLPLLWSIPLLTVLGAVGGWIVFAVWNEEVGRVVIDHQAVRLESKKTTSVYSREEIAEVFLDKDELVILDHRFRELSRTASDNGLASKLATSFIEFEYPWAGAKDPRDEAFIEWVDRSGNLHSVTHSLLRARHRALTDGKAGEADALREQLAAHGIVVRDRGGKQQYRLSTDAPGA